MSATTNKTRRGLFGDGTTPFETICISLLYHRGRFNVFLFEVFDPKYLSTSLSLEYLITDICLIEFT